MSESINTDFPAYRRVSTVVWPGILLDRRPTMARPTSCACEPSARDLKTDAWFTNSDSVAHLDASHVEKVFSAY